METDIYKKFNAFRQFCLTNSEDAIRTAESLLNKNVNHIAFHLSVFALEEVGKIFIGWYQLNSTESWDKEHVKIPIDDHIKKLFWAIWGPSFTQEKFTKEQMDDISGMATNLHNRRLDVMYTDLYDTLPSAAKITNEETEIYVKMVRARLELEKIGVEVKETFDLSEQEELKWFMTVSDIPTKRTFIFGHTSQEKLIELGNVKNWMHWLKETFDQEEKYLKDIFQKEINKPSPSEEQVGSPKWKIRFKVITPSHSIRQNQLNDFNKKVSIIQLFKGGDSHTLFIDVILDNHTSLQGLFHHGWMFSRIFVAALNVGTNGFFWWNTILDKETYYEKITDLENRKEVVAKLQSGLRLNWEDKKMVLNEAEIEPILLAFGYFSFSVNKPIFEAIDIYITGLAMLAKSDIHLRFEVHTFNQFYQSFRKAILLNNNNNNDSEINVKEFGYKELENILQDRTEFNRIMDIANSLQQDITSKPITLTEIISIKQYCGLYFLTLAARYAYKNDEIKLTRLNNPEGG